MLAEIDKLTTSGSYEKALAAAKVHALECMKNSQYPEAALALSRASAILCTLNHPTKARSYAQEALNLACRANHKPAIAYAHAVLALASLRLGAVDRAEHELDTALETPEGGTESREATLIRLIGAEISLAQEDFVEARAFAHDALAIATSLQDAPLLARVYLIQAIAEEHAENLAGALERLRAADAALSPTTDLEAGWQVKAALANLLARSGKEEVAASMRREARAMLDPIIHGLPDESRTRFLKSPLIARLLGEEDSSLANVPLHDRTQESSEKKEETSFQRLRPVLEVIKKINSELDLRRLITIILDTMLEYCNAQRGTLVVFEGDHFKIELSRSRTKVDLKPNDMGLSRGIVKLVRDRGEKIVTVDARQDRQLRLIDSVQDQRLISILCLPLRVKRRLVGAVYLDNALQPAAFGTREIELAEILTDHAAVAIDNALLHITSTHDTLTSLYNHAHFEKQLEGEIARCRRHARPCSVLMLDIDDFKRINDTHGHERGNEILRAISHTLATVVRHADLVARVQEWDNTPIVARYGGDEFEIILPEASHDGAHRAAERILQTLAEQPLLYEGQPVHTTCSIGGATFPNDAPDPRELMLRADEALYAAKRAGKNQYVAYSACRTTPKPL